MYWSLWCYCISMRSLSLSLSLSPVLPGSQYDIGHDWLWTGQRAGRHQQHPEVSPHSVLICQLQQLIYSRCKLGSAADRRRSNINQHLTDSCCSLPTVPQKQTTLIFTAPLTRTEWNIVTIVIVQQSLHKKTKKKLGLTRRSKNNLRADLRVSVSSS